MKLLGSDRKFVFVLLVGIAVAPTAVVGQAVKTVPPEDAPPPALTYHGLIPGVDTMETVKAKLGEPFYAGRWYNYKMYYHAEDREGLIDVVHMHGDKPTDRLANIEAATAPEGYETESGIRKQLGTPEYELRMHTWKMLDYTEQGVRFALDSDGATIGVAYIPHGEPRVHSGARSLMDLTHLRQGPQPKPRQIEEIENLQCGTAEVVISPQEQDWLPQPFEIHDDLKARIATFSNGEVTVGLVGADNFGMGWDDVAVMREAARRIGYTDIIFAMSHNHATGDTIGVYGHYPAEYVGYIQSQVSVGLEKALRNLRPVGGVRTISKELPMDGIRVQDLFRNARNPGVLDPQLAVMQVVDPENEPIATLVHFACHVESLQAGAREISADFPGYMCDALEEEGYGQAVFLNGAVGGMVSGDNRARTHESSKVMGVSLAKLVADALKEAQPTTETHFSLDRRRVEIPMTNERLRPLFGTGLRSLYDGRVVTDMLYFRLGAAQFVTLPGEVLPEVSFEILEHMTGYPRMLIGLGNDQLGYIIPPYDFRSDYYEETVSQGPAAAPVVRDTAVRLVKGIP